MAYVPVNAVKTLWYEMGDNKDWESLKDTLRKNPGIGKEVVNNLLGKLRMVAERMKNYDFPDSPEELAQVLGQRLATWDDDTHPSIDELSG